MIGEILSSEVLGEQPLKAPGGSVAKNLDGSEKLPGERGHACHFSPQVMDWFPVESMSVLNCT